MSHGGSIVSLITVPILVGMALKAGQVRGHTRLSRKLRLTCVACVLVLCVEIIATRSDQLKADWQLATIASASLALGAMTIGWAMSWMLKMAAANRRACLISFAVRNVGLAATIAVAMMDRIEYVIPSTVYLLTEASILFLAVATFRFRPAIIEPPASANI